MDRDGGGSSEQFTEFGGVVVEDVFAAGVDVDRTGRGSRAEQAERDLYARAVSAGIEPLGAATLILAALSPPEPEPV